MAQRRMFDKSIISSARFLRAPIDSQALYFHLCLNADDDGVVEAFSVLRLTNISEDNLKVLAAKNLVTILSEDLLTYINDWTTHNRIRADRKIDSRYKDLLIQINAPIVESRTRADAQKDNKKIDGQPMDNQWTTNGRHSIGKVSIGKVSIGEGSIGKYSIDKVSIDKNSITKVREKSSNELLVTPKIAKGKRDFKEYLKDFNKIANRDFRILDTKTAKQIEALERTGYTLADFQTAVYNLYADRFHKDSNYKYATPEYITRPSIFEKYVVKAGKPISVKNRPRNNRDALPEGDLKLLEMWEEQGISQQQIRIGLALPDDFIF